MADYSGFGNIVLDADELDKKLAKQGTVSDYATEQLDKMSNENNPKAFKKYLDKQKELELKKFKCGESKITSLSAEGAKGAATGALELLSGGMKGSICKHIEETYANRLKTAKEGISLWAQAEKGVGDFLAGSGKALGGAAWYGGALVIKTLWGFAAGVITVLLPDPFKKWWIAIVKWINQATYTLLNFNWNISDGELNKQSWRWINTAVGQSGELIGKSLGWIACGLSPVAGVAVFNPEQAALLLADVGEEAIDEIGEELYALANQIKRGATNAVFLQLYKGVRSILRNPQSPFYAPLVIIFGKERVDTWGTANSKPWSINIAVNEWIESFKNEAMQNFLEELYEGTIEGCQEGFITFANSASLSLVDRSKVSAKKTIEIKAKEL